VGVHDGNQRERVGVEVGVCVFVSCVLSKAESLEISPVLSPDFESTIWPILAVSIMSASALS
jgi:hypothetical protein